jgi:hypothetical protein
MLNSILNAVKSQSCVVIPIIQDLEKKLGKNGCTLLSAELLLTPMSTIMS